LLLSRATIVTILPEDVESVTGDPEDDAVLATVRLGLAEYLVTGDHGLLDLGTYAGARIVSPRTFLSLLGE
jgi:predicted nucleic acid-binding protein